MGGILLIVPEKESFSGTIFLVTPLHSQKFVCICFYA
jgi:hypothetical protein